MKQAETGRYHRTLKKISSIVTSRGQEHPSGLPNCGGTKHSVVLSYPVPDHLLQQPQETDEDSVGMRWEAAEEHDRQSSVPSPPHPFLLCQRPESEVPGPLYCISALVLPGVP